MSSRSTSEQINLHHSSEIRELAGALAEIDEEQLRIIVLAGDPGAGRRYFVARAAAHARANGQHILHTALDLDGVEVERPDLHAYAAFQAEKYNRDLDERAQALLEQLTGRRPQLGWDEISLAAAAVGADAESAALLDRIESVLSSDDPWNALVDALQDGERLAVHCVDLVETPATLRQRLLDLAAERPEFKLLVSAYRGQSLGKAMDGLPQARFEIMPFEPGEVVVALEQYAVSPETVQRIQQETAGALGGVARAIATIERDGEEALRPWDQALATLPEDEAKRLMSFAHLAALCGDNIPVRLLFEFLGVEDDALDDAIDQLDETLGSDSELQLFDKRFQHPSFERETIYGFAGRDRPCSLRESLSPESRQRLALELLRFLSQKIQVGTRASARLLLEICRHAEAVENRRQLERELAWRVGPPDADALRELLIREMRSGQRPPAQIWSAINAAQMRWAPYRTLALTDALGAVLQPEQLTPAYYAIRSGLLRELGRFDEALADAEAGLERESGDKMLRIALLERVGWAREKLGRAEEAQQAYNACRQLLDEIAAEGDPRAKQLLEALGPTSG